MSYNDRKLKEGEKQVDNEVRRAEGERMKEEMGES